MVVELLSYDEIAVHTNVKEAVDALLLGGFCRAEERRILGGEMKVVKPAKISFPVKAEPTRTKITPVERPTRGRRKHG